MKYTTLFLVLFGIIAVCSAGRTYSIYKDATCVNAYSSYFWSTDECPVKRSTQVECLQIDSTDYYYLPDCTDSATIPNGWTSFTLFTGTTCAGTGSSYLYAVSAQGQSIPIVISNAGNILMASVNVTCGNNGMQAQRCSSGCANDLISYNTCTVFDGYSGNQTACMGTAPVAAPMAAAPMPSGPVAATPAKKSAASVVALSGFVLLAGLLAF